MKRVVVVDYGMGNLDSIRRAIEECGGEPVVTDDPGVVKRAPSLVLPGVGAFAHGMRNLRERKLEEPLNEQVLGRGVPCLGVCLGMQLLARRGEESGETAGLGWIDGDVRRLVPANGERVPHVGWNEVHVEQRSPLFAGLDDGRDFYFVHSFHFTPSDPDAVVARTPYGGGFASAVAKDNVHGVQFHPEKSQRAGFEVLANFLAL